MENPARRSLSRLSSKNPGGCLYSSPAPSLSSAGQPPPKIFNEPPSIEIITRLSGTRAALVVRDNGNGFPPDVLPRALEPYFTTRPHGSGLGLAIVKKIIDEHGGDIRITNRDAGGAEVRVRLRTERIREGT